MNFEEVKEFEIFAAAGNQQLAAAAVAQAAGEANPLLLHVGGGQHHVGFTLFDYLVFRFWTLENAQD